MYVRTLTVLSVAMITIVRNFHTRIKIVQNFINPVRKYSYVPLIHTIVMRTHNIMIRTFEFPTEVRISRFLISLYRYVG